MGISVGKLQQCVDEMAEGKWTVFARKAGLTPNAFRAWLDGRSEPSMPLFQKLLAFTKKPASFFYPDDEILIREPSTPYEVYPEQIGIPRIGRDGDQRDPGAMSYTAPDPDVLGRYSVTRVADPENKRYLEMAAEVLESPEAGTREAFKSNIVQFYEQVQDKQRARNMERKIAELEKLLRKHPASGGAAAEV